MSITYQCERCGRWYTVREGKVGTLARCRDCGHEMKVPNAPDLFDDVIDGPVGGAAPVRSRPTTSSPATPTSRTPAPTPSRPAGQADGASGKLWGGGLGVAGFILIVVLKMAIHGRAFRQPPRAPRGPKFAVQAPATVAKVQAGDLDGPIAIPTRFPDLGEAREIEPGVSLAEVTLRPEGHPAPPGHSGRLWLYLPSAKGRPAPRSLPCVLIAPAGSTLLTGMQLAAADRPEHLPYVRAGFAVLAFELDGADPVPGRPGLPPKSSMLEFLRARAGLVNGAIAKAFLRAKVPAVDPDRLYVAGHSSAATFALLLAEHDRDLKGCVAYAPVVDIASHLGVLGGAQARSAGFSDLITRFSPQSDPAKLHCPVLLFHARDDTNVPFERTVAFADRLKALHKPVTLDLVDDGDHVDAMIREGLPRGVDWLKARDAEVRRGKP